MRKVSFTTASKYDSFAVESTAMSTGDSKLSLIFFFEKQLQRVSLKAVFEGFSLVFGLGGA